MDLNLGLVITWAILTIVLICVEVATVQFVAVWFALGSLAAFISSLFGLTLIPTLIIFIVTSVVFLLLTRPFVKKFSNTKPTPTNADSIIGMTGVVSEKIENIDATGRIMVNGISWAARAADSDTIFESDEKAKVVAIEGVSAIVVKIS